MFTYHLKAVIRQVLFYSFRPIAKRGNYNRPSEIMGYEGWYALPIVGVVAFVHQDDGLQFLW